MRHLLVILVLFLGAGCSSRPEGPQRVEFVVESPISAASQNSRGTQKSRIEGQLSGRYPVGAWITDVKVESEPSESVEDIKLHYVYPDRHYRILGLPRGADEFWISPAEIKGGIPIRSNEPFWLEVTWNTQSPPNSELKVIVDWTDQRPNKILQPHQMEDGFIYSELSNFLGFPEKLY